ncbi:MAG: hypothetical protein U0547_10450 [Dehalococcoidia bacterium]
MDLLLAQVARLLGLERAGLTAEGARAAIAARPGDLGLALVAEAADSDDVTDAESARVYLAGRLADLVTLIPPASVEAVRAAFEAGIAAWEAAG